MGSFPSTSSTVPLFWPRLEFSLLLFGLIVAVPSYFFVFYHILTEKGLRKHLQNHVMLVLLFYNFLIVTINLPIILNFARLGYVSPSSPALCLVWQFVDNGIWYGGVALMFWASFERHILVFHANLVSTTRRRILIHYTPLAFFALYTPLIYVYLVFFYSCGQVYDFTKMLCGSICLYTNAPNWLQLYDSYVDYTLPILLIPLCSGALLFRFVRQKQRMQQVVTWRHCRKMTIQLVLVSTVYIIFDLPAVIVFIVQSSGDPSFGSDIYFPFLSHMTMVPSIIVPFATLLALPKFTTKLRALCIWKHNRRAVLPTTTTTMN